jgi:antirestriction protein
MANASLKTITSFYNPTPHFSAVELSAFAEYPNTDTPHLYIACQQSYEQNIVHGSWIDATQALEHIEAKIETLLSLSPIPHAKKWFIRYSSGFMSIRIEPQSSLAEITQIARFLEEYGNFGAELLLLHDQDIEAAEKVLDDAQFSDSPTALESLAEHFGDSPLESLPAFLRCYLQDRVLEDSACFEEAAELPFG